MHRIIAHDLRWRLCYTVAMTMIAIHDIMMDRYIYIGKKKSNLL